MRCYYLSSGLPWSKISTRLCRPGGIFSNLAQAQTACLQLGSSCHCVYDQYCDGHRLNLCKIRPFSTAHRADCVYKSTSAIAMAGGSQPTKFTPPTGTSLKSAVNSCYSTKTSDLPSGQVHDIQSKEDLSKLQATGQLVVVDWYAHWCGPCKMFKPIFKKMAEEQTDILFCKIDVDELQDLAAEYGIRSMPTFKASYRTISQSNLRVHALKQHQLDPNLPFVT